MGIDLSNAKISQAYIASDNAVISVQNYYFKSIKAKSPELANAFKDLETSTSDLPKEQKERIAQEIEVLKGEVVKTEPDRGIAEKSLAVLEQTASLIVNAPVALKSITSLILLAKQFFGF